MSVSEHQETSSESVASSTTEIKRKNARTRAASVLVKSGEPRTMTATHRLDPRSKGAAIAQLGSPSIQVEEEPK